MKFMTLSTQSRLALFPGATFELRSQADGLKFLRPLTRDQDDGLLAGYGLLVSNDLLHYSSTVIIPQMQGQRTKVEITLHSASIVNFKGARMAVPPVPHEGAESFLVWIPSLHASVQRINNDEPHFSNGCMMPGLYMLKPGDRMIVKVQTKRSKMFELRADGSARQDPGFHLMQIDHDGKELLVDGMPMDSTTIFK